MCIEAFLKYDQLSSCFKLLGSGWPGLSHVAFYFITVCSFHVLCCVSLKCPLSVVKRDFLNEIYYSFLKTLLKKSPIRCSISNVSFIIPMTIKCDTGLCLTLCSRVRVSFESGSTSCPMRSSIQTTACSLSRLTVRIFHFLTPE